MVRMQSLENAQLQTYKPACSAAPNDCLFPSRPNLILRRNDDARKESTALQAL